MGQKLEKDALLKVTSLISKYQECHDEIKELEKQMESISSEMNSKLAELHGLRNEEMDLYENLSHQYGTGYLDTQNLEWIKK